MAEISKEALDIILKMQQNEITESEVYKKIAIGVKDQKNKEVLLRIAGEERKHHDIWAHYTNKQLTPNMAKVNRLAFLAKLFGFTFVIKRMENGEELAQDTYDKLVAEIAEAATIKRDEEHHEAALMELLDEEKLQYVGSMVLGMNDALVELTGTLAGLTLALQSTKLVALSGLITGISATLSMASSEYLSAKSEGREDALKSCTYTGFTYLLTVVAMSLPYLLFADHQYLLALGCLILVVICIIVVFNYYISVCKNLDFKKRVGEMLAISLGVAALSFVIGLLVKQFLGIDI